MTYFEIQEKLILTDKMNENHSFLELEFPYKTSYELMNLAIIKAAENGELHISFDFVDWDLSEIKNKTLTEIESESRMVYPSYDTYTHALKETFSYPRYLAARGFEIEIKNALKPHGYPSKSYHISWNK